MNDNTIRKAMTEGYQFDSYKDIGQIEDVVRWKINEALRLKGQSSMETNMLETIIKKVTEVIQRDYPTMTDKELELLLEMGVSGEFGKDTWINGGIILLWMRQYWHSAGRISIIDADNEEAKKKARKTKEEILELNRIALEGSYNNSLEYYRLCGTIWSANEDERAKKAKMDPNDKRCFHLPQWAAIVYDHYRKSGMISAPTEEQLTQSKEWAAKKVVEHSTKKDFIPGALHDWQAGYLLEAHIRGLAKNN